MRHASCYLFIQIARQSNKFLCFSSGSRHTRFSRDWSSDVCSSDLGLPLTDEEQMQLTMKWGGVEAWGTEMMYPHYSTAWAWAGNTPFAWGKQVASHLGGTRNPLVVRYPKRAKDGGGLRSQFTHVTDIGPTILDIVGIPQPSHVDGVEQQPMTGSSFADS